MLSAANMLANDSSFYTVSKKKEATVF